MMSPPLGLLSSPKQPQKVPIRKEEWERRLHEVHVTKK